MEMSATKTRLYFEKMKSIFNRIINNDNVIPLTAPLNFNDCHWNHQIMNEIYDSIGQRPYDYLYDVDKNIYGLDISLDADELGYNDEYIFNKYPDLYDNLYCCSLTDLGDEINRSEEKSVMSFIYDSKNRRILEVLDLYAFHNTTEGKEVSNSQYKILKRLIR